MIEIIAGSVVGTTSACALQWWLHRRRLRKMGRDYQAEWDIFVHDEMGGVWNDDEQRYVYPTRNA
jgi:hypothetical protein